MAIWHRRRRRIRTVALAIPTARHQLRLPAEQIVSDYLALAQAEPRPNRAAHDHLLLTAHQRIDTRPPVDTRGN